MFPASIIDNIFNTSYRNIKCLSQLFYWYARFRSNIDYIGGGQLCLPIFLTNKTSISFFKISVFHVFLMASKKQMLRIYTSGVIAFMQNMQIFIKGPVVQKIRSSMSAPSFFLNRDNTISMALRNRTPNPARWSFFDISPKSFNPIIRFGSAFSHGPIIIMGAI